MADQSDVEAALVAAIAGALDAAGLVASVYRGWPEASLLQADGPPHVSVFAGTLQDTTRFAPTWQASARAAVLLVSVNGDTATFSGRGTPGQLAGLLVDGVSYVHRTVTGDSPELVAAVLAAAVRRERIAIQSGASVIVPNAVRLTARTVADQLAVQELRRQLQRFQVTVWCAAPALRDLIAGTVDAALAASPVLDVDGQACRCRLAATASQDRPQSSPLYRRDLTYAVEYPTTRKADLPAMLFGTLTQAGIPFIT
jgi:hypothetical protein